MNKNIVKPRKKIYCTRCGSQLVETMVGAENYIAQYDDDSFQPYEAFDDKTGKRQYVFRYTCPNKKWFNIHNNYIIDDVVKI